MIRNVITSQWLPWIYQAPGTTISAANATFTAGCQRAMARKSSTFLYTPRGAEGSARQARSTRKRIATVSRLPTSAASGNNWYAPSTNRRICSEKTRATAPAAGIPTSAINESRGQYLSTKGLSACCVVIVAILSAPVGALSKMVIERIGGANSMPRGCFQNDRNCLPARFCAKYCVLLGRQP